VTGWSLGEGEGSSGPQRRGREKTEPTCEIGHPTSVAEIWGGEFIFNRAGARRHNVKKRWQGRVRERTKRKNRGEDTAVTNASVKKGVGAVTAAAVRRGKEFTSNHRGRSHHRVLRVRALSSKHSPAKKRGDEGKRACPPRTPSEGCHCSMKQNGVVQKVSANGKLAGGRRGESGPNRQGDACRVEEEKKKAGSADPS